MTDTTFDTAQRETLRTFRDAYRKLARERKLTPQDIIAYNIMRGLPKDRGFTDIINPTKLANGAYPNWAFVQAKEGLQINTRPGRAAKFAERFAPIQEDTINSIHGELK